MPCALIVDDHDVFRASASALLESEGFTVAEAATAETGIDAAVRLRPDVVLLDIQLPDHDGFHAATLLARLEQPPVVILTSSRDPSDYGYLIADSTAAGFIPKSEVSGETIWALLRTTSS
jgi:DNA-binding NarL/FixJ family response regulator